VQLSYLWLIFNRLEKIHLHTSPWSLKTENKNKEKDLGGKDIKIAVN
jgi:hypothetical protein